MAKKKENAQKGNYSLEENLALTNEELVSNWSKFASLVRTAENLEWGDAKDKAVLLFKDKPAAIDYIESVRSGKISPANPDPNNSRIKSLQKIAKSIPDNDDSESEPTKKPIRRDRFSMNYKRLLKLIPDLEKRLLSGEEIWGQSKKTAYLPFNIELTYQKESEYYLAMSHTYEQNGDLVPDPDMVILFDVEMKIVEALSFQNYRDYHEAYDNIYERNKVDLSLKKSMNSFLETWLKNLIDQEHEIKWKHIKPIQPKKRKSGSDSGSLLEPDVSYMEESVIAGIREYYNKMMFDTVLNQFLDHIDGKQPMRAVARYFAVKRIDESPFLNSSRLKYPTEDELKEDYDQLIELQRKNRQVDRSIESMALRTESKENEVDSELEQTAKHWKKLAKVIREMEPSISLKDSEEKARELKSKDKAIDYLLEGMKGSNRKQLTELKKANYQKLIRLIPKLNDRLKDDTLNGRLISTKGEEDFSYSLESAAEISKTKKQFAIQDEKGEGSLLIAVLKVRKQVYVSTHANQLLNASNFLSDSDEFTLDDSYQVNLRFGQWLDKLIKSTKGANWDDQNEGNAEPEQLLKLEDFHIFRVGDLVTRHKNSSSDKIYRVQKLNDIQETDTDLKVVIEDSLGIVDETIEQEYLKLVLSIDDYDPTTFDWKNKVLGNIEKEPSSTISDDFEQKQVVAPYNPLGSLEEVEKLLEKYPIVYEYSRTSGYINRGYKTIKGLSRAIAEYGWDKDQKDSSVANVLFFKGDQSGFMITVSNKANDYNPESDDLEQYLREKFDGRLDWSYFNSRLSRKERNLAESSQKELEKAKKDAATIPVFEIGKVKLTEQHKRAGLTQKDINWINKNKQGIVLTPRREPINNTKSMAKDKEFQAKLPGKRISATGRIYYEGRSNRSDLGKDGL